MQEKMSYRRKTNSGSVYNVSYHLIRCPKYRRKVLIDGADVRLKELLLQKAEEMGIVIETMEVMPDHVHLFVKAPPTIAIPQIVKGFKGFTSRIMRQEFKHIRTRLPSLWTNSYYVETIGHISESTIKRYIEDQKRY